MIVHCVQLEIFRISLHCTQHRSIKTVGVASLIRFDTFGIRKNWQSTQRAKPKFYEIIKKKLEQKERAKFCNQMTEKYKPVRKCAHLRHFIHYNITLYHCKASNYSNMEYIRRNVYGNQLTEYHLDDVPSQICLICRESCLDTKNHTNTIRCIYAINRKNGITIHGHGRSLFWVVYGWFGDWKISKYPVYTIFTRKYVV